MDAVKEGIAREKNDEPYAKQVLAEHLQTQDPRALDETYQYYAREILPDVPTPTVQRLLFSTRCILRSIGFAI